MKLRFEVELDSRYVTMDGETFVAVLRLVESYYELVDASEAVVKELSK